MTVFSNEDKGIIAKSVEVASFCEAFHLSHESVEFALHHSFRYVPIHIRKKPNARVSFATYVHWAPHFRDTTRLVNCQFVLERANFAKTTAFSDTQFGVRPVGHRM